MDWVLKNGKFNWEWSFFDYCRVNGIGKYGKSGARPIESAVFTGSIQSGEGDEMDGEEFLSMGEVVKYEESKLESIDPIELLGESLDLRKETIRWIAINYKA